MDVTTYSDFRRSLKSYLDRVFTSRSPLFIKRANGEDMVVMSKADYESMEETFYLMKSPKNAARLLRGIEQFNQGRGNERVLIEE
ncbi:type II toxin-antitoxin system prevent-host-death family antitoxin [Solitalea sp. MAHUQ-68]|uniref:Antitoxin n=1 Tax=Solitalea agri TaxID=2953739 RepID=A0A9X2JES1_9SPHI|nr:type II toxin-antitoxin system prevent-host-death family antitoxin [Solitalea agri]MCO4292691.1 type II toxin-antitoxin system prevent-host-death family antitoxin [Solitalea agri]